MDIKKELQSIDKEKLGSSMDILQLVSFNIGEEEFGLDILRVQEIIRMIEITRVPNAPKFIVGVINLRGKVIPIIDLRTRMGMEPKDRDKDTRIIVIEIDAKIVGFIVDKVNEVLRIDKSITQSPPPMVSGIDSDYITSIAQMEDRLLILLDLTRLLSSSEGKQLDEIPVPLQG